MTCPIDRNLHRFAHEFYGYGNYQGKIWFIGMEEGGGNSENEIETRINAWASHSRELEDVASYHQAIGISQFFTPTPVLQTTWSKLIRLLLCFQNIAPTMEKIRLYQRDEFGRRDNETCLLELMPLPSPSTNEWLYSRISSLPYLETRKKYTEKLLEFRIKAIQEKIFEYAPEIVIFYSKKYTKYWEQIAGIPLTEFENNISIGHNQSTTFAIVTHPATRGVTNEYFCQAGNIIRALQREKRLP